MRFILVTALVVLAPIAAAAQSPDPVCGATPAPPPPELAGWAARVPRVAATAPAGLAEAPLTPGNAVDAGLAPTPRIDFFVAPPGKPGTPASHGGLFDLTIAKPGTYRIALGGPAWIDVLRDGAAVASSAHGHGPACTGIRKTVDFPLVPGRYVVQLAGSATPAVAAMVARLP